MSAAPQWHPIEFAHLDRYTGGDCALNTEVLQLFENQMTQILQRLECLLDAPDARAWSEIIHSLKGASRGVGAFPLGDAAAAAEGIDPACERGRAEEALGALHRQCDIVKSSIDAYLGR
jgi:HPt (histidine-containing phosphotransfer) domain-containing protein